MRNPARFIAEPLVRYLNRREWRRQQFIKLYERPLEYAFALQCISDEVPHHVLDVGAGKSPWPALMRTCGCMVTAVDQITGYWGPSGFHNPHYHVINDDITDSRLTQKYDMVTCISVLEHIPDHRAAVRSMLSALSPGGTLVLTVPFSQDEYVENVYSLPEASYGKDFNYVCQVFTPAQVEQWTTDTDAEVVRQEYYHVFSGRLWSFGERVYPYERVAVSQPHELTSIMIRKSR